MENNKTQAEIYREERKARLAKAAAKQAKKSPKISKTKKVIGKVIAIVIAVAIGLGAVGGILNFFGAPQKALKVSIGDSDYKFTVAEYNYYYYNTWNTYQSNAYQYETYYGEGMGKTLLGFDYKTAPAQQEYTEDIAAITGLTLEDLGNPENPTWADAFSYAAISQILQIKFGASKAVENGLTLTEEQEEEIDKYIEDARANAKKYDYSLDRWLHSQIGKGISEKLIREIQKESYLATAYYEKLEKDTTNAITEEQINTEYKNNQDKYDVIDARIYTMVPISADVKEDATADEKKAAEDKAAADTKANAEKFIAAVTDEESFVKEAQRAILTEDNESTVKAEESTLAENVQYAELESLSEELVKWAYDDSRKVGDKGSFKNADGSYTLIYMTAIPHKDMSVSSSDVRHILVQFETTTDADGNTSSVTDTEKAKCKAEAQAILDEYKKNPTVENFAKLATEKTDDGGSRENGGLYEKVADDGQYVEAFAKWVVDPSRKPGDTDIVETEYGYHVMYYVKANDDAWYATVKNAIFTEEYTKITDEVMDGYMKEMKFDSAVLNWAEKNQSKFIGQLVIQMF